MDVETRRKEREEEMKALDLFCGAGGASKGLAYAGFITSIVGVDIHPQKHYPYRFMELDALMLSIHFLRTFDLIWASPPCQKFSVMTKRWHREDDHVSHAAQEKP